MILATTRDKEFIPLIKELVEDDLYPGEGQVIYQDEHDNFVVNIDVYGDVLTLAPLVLWKYVLLAVERHLLYKRFDYEQCPALIEEIQQKIELSQH